MATKVIFTQPFQVNSQLAAQCGQRVVVLDLAFNAGSPQGNGTAEEQFQKTTGAFIEALGDRLAAWVDHHPHAAWSMFANDPRFILKSRDEAPACPPVITTALVAQFGDVDTVIAHGDFDGVVSAAKWLLGGQEPYDGADADSVAADTRKGQLSQTGQRFEAAMKANLADNTVRQAVLADLTGDENARQIVDAAQARYASIQAETVRLAALFEIHGVVACVDAVEAAPFDLTGLLLAGQKKASVAMVRSVQQGKPQITVAGPQGWDFVEIFGLPGGMPNRVNLPDGDNDMKVAVINTASLLREIAAESKSLDFLHVEVNGLEATVTIFDRTYKLQISSAEEIIR